MARLTVDEPTFSVSELNSVRHNCRVRALLEIALGSQVSATLCDPGTFVGSRVILGL